MQFQFIILYIFLFFLAVVQILFAGYLNKKYRKSYIEVFFYLVIVNAALGIAEILVRFLLPRVLNATNEQMIKISMIFGFIVVPVMIIDIYIFMLFMFSLLRGKFPNLIRYIYFIFWGLFLTGFVIAEMEFFSSGSMRLTNILEKVFEFGIIVFGFGVCFYIIIKRNSIENKRFRRFVVLITFYYLVMFFIGILLFTAILPIAFNRVMSYIYIAVHNIPPLIAFYLYLRKVITDPRTTSRDLDMVLKSYAVSKREKDVLLLILEGKSNKEIQDSLYISLRTVETHIYRIYQKFGVKNRIQLVNYLNEKG